MKLINSLLMTEVLLHCPSEVNDDMQQYGKVKYIHSRANTNISQQGTWQEAELPFMYYYALFILHDFHTLKHDLKITERFINCDKPGWWGHERLEMFLIFINGCFSEWQVLALLGTHKNKITHIKQNQMQCPTFQVNFSFVQVRTGMNRSILVSGIW